MYIYGHYDVCAILTVLVRSTCNNIRMYVCMCCIYYVYTVIVLYVIENYNCWSVFLVTNNSVNDVGHLSHVCTLYYMYACS